MSLATRAAAAAIAALAAAPPCAGAAPAAAAPTPHAPAYGREPEVSLSALEASALRAVAQELRRGGARPRTSGALVLASRELAARAAAGQAEPIARDRLQGALARAGAFDASPAALLVSAQPDDVAGALSRALPRRRATHAGVGIVQRGGAAFAVVLLSERGARLDPFPRDVVPGASAVLGGTLSPALARPRVFVTLPSGAVEEPPAATVSGSPAFRARLAFRTAGRHVVQVVAEGARGPEVAALLTVSAGGASLDPPPRPPSPPEPADRAASEAAIVAALNDTRRRHGLPPAASAPELAAVARRHSEAMAASTTLAHLVPGSGDVGERLRRASVPYRRAYENVGRAATGLDAHAAIEESPAHLANVLRPGASRVGVGVARATLPSGDPTVYVTEILVEPADAGGESRLTVDARVRESLWRERARLGLEPLTADPALDALARDAALAMRSRDDTEAEGLGARALAFPRRLAAVDVFVASAPDEAVRSANLRDPRFGRVGVGVAEGDSRRFGSGRLWIAVVYTD